MSVALLISRYHAVRRFTEALCAPLAVEDYVVQSMPDCSPAKWHLAHTSWFFETFVLLPHLPGYRALHPQYCVLFNSYYNTVGAQHTRAYRGLLSRPTVAEVYAYRAHVDQKIAECLAAAPEAREVLALVELGLHHEQQHQELLLTDLKHLLAQNPLRPSYHLTPPGSLLPRGATPPPLRLHAFAAGLYEIGCDGASGFTFDNEGPRHRVYLQAYALGSRLVTCGEYQAFIADGGYSRPELWLSDGWSTVRAHGWQAPLYWEETDAGAACFTLAGLLPIDPHAPVCHVSYYEADAYARWAGARLPSEAEWEHAATPAPLRGHFADSGLYHPAPLCSTAAPCAATPTPSQPIVQMFGDVWEWTQSPYAPYPGYRSPPGAIGEYNGKFMCNQLVLRGGSCATPAGHVRPSYRNFFPPAARWQFSGIRLAQDA